MRWFQRKSKCPNCNQSLDKKPSRKKKCPHCKQYIYVRSGRLVTEAEATKIDWLKKLDGWDVSNKDYDRYHKELSNQFGFSAPVNDTVWRILNDLKIKHANEPGAQAGILREMADLVKSEGKDPSQFLADADEAQRSIEFSDSVHAIRWRTANDNSVCPTCKDYNEKVFSKENRPVCPHPDCTSDMRCRCYITPIVLEALTKKEIRELNWYYASDRQKFSK